MVIFHSTQPVMLHHSSQGLGHGSNKHYGFVYTKALLAEACGWKRCDGIFWKNFSFLLYIKWASNVRGYPLPQTTCWGLSKTPVYAESILRLRVQRTLFSAFKNLENRLIQKRVRWFFVQWEEVSFDLSPPHIKFNSKSFRSRYVTLDVMWCIVLC